MLNACDPANCYGPASENAPQTAAGAPLTFARLPSTWLVLNRGLPLLLAEDSGARLTTMVARTRALAASYRRVAATHGYLHAAGAGCRVGWGAGAAQFRARAVGGGGFCAGLSGDELAGVMFYLCRILAYAVARALNEVMKARKLSSGFGSVNCPSKPAACPDRIRHAASYSRSLINRSQKSS